LSGCSCSASFMYALRMSAWKAAQTSVGKRLRDLPRAGHRWLPFLVKWKAPTHLVGILCHPQCLVERLAL
jgi:hypothetical protein